MINDDLEIERTPFPLSLTVNIFLKANDILSGFNYVHKMSSYLLL